MKKLFCLFLLSCTFIVGVMGQNLNRARHSQARGTSSGHLGFRGGNRASALLLLREISKGSLSTTCLIALSRILDSDRNTGYRQHVFPTGNGVPLQPYVNRNNYQSSSLSQNAVNTLLPYFRNGRFGYGRNWNDIISILSYCNGDGDDSFLSTLITYFSLLDQPDSITQVPSETCTNYVLYGNSLFMNINPDSSRYCYPSCGVNGRCTRNSFNQLCFCEIVAQSPCPQPCHRLATCKPPVTLLGGHRCVCNYPYTGNGINECRLQNTASPSVFPGSTLCNGRRCGNNANCLYDIVDNQYKCKCNLYFRGDGFNCYYDSFTPQTTCVPPCDSINGYCEYDYQQRTYECKCNTGYTIQTGGATRSCIKASLALDHSSQELCTPPCGQHSFCTYNFDAYKFQCKCREGYSSQQSGNGRNCISISQQISPPLAPALSFCFPSCGDNSYCSYDVQRQSYGCLCDDGYTKGNGNVCGLIATIPTSRVCSPTCDANKYCDCVSQLQCECKCNSGYFPIPMQSGGFNCYNPF